MGEKETADRAGWVVLSGRGDFWQKDGSKGEKKGLQDGGESRGVSHETSLII